MGARSTYSGSWTPYAVERVLSSLFPPSVAICAVAIQNPLQVFSREKGRLIAPRRRDAELAAGRVCARRALERLGEGKVVVGIEPDGAPAWPQGIVGAISHSGGFAVAAVARSSELDGVGVDLMAVRRLADGCANLFCASSELQWLERPSEADRPHRILVLFSAKESVQKCARHLLAQLPDMQVIEVNISPGPERFTARVDGLSGMDWAGRYAVEAGLLFSAVTARADVLDREVTG